MKQKLMKMILPVMLLMSSCISAGEYTGKELPKELQFGSEMKAFHKRDFFKEVKDLIFRIFMGREEVINKL